MSQEPVDAARLFVPLHDAACGVSLRLFRGRDGSRCAVGFTTTERLVSMLGTQQRYYRLTEHAVRALARERGAHALIVDPGLVAAAVSPTLADQADEADQAGERVAGGVPEPVTVPELPVTDRRRPLRSPWQPELAGLLAVGAVTSAAALLMQVLP